MVTSLADDPGGRSEPPPARNATRAVLAATALLWSGYLVAAVNGLGARFDGAYYVFRVIDTGSFTIVSRRYTAALWQAPAVIASAADASPVAVKTLFSLGYGVAEVGLTTAALLLLRPSRGDVDATARWWIGFAGLTVGLVPAVTFWVSEALITYLLGWLAFAVMSSTRVSLRSRVIVVPVLALLAAFQHPFGTLVCVALAAGSYARVGIPRDTRPTLAGVLLLIALSGLVAHRICGTARHHRHGSDASWSSCRSWLALPRRDWRACSWRSHWRSRVSPSSSGHEATLVAGSPWS